jgi:hypothetical protein
MQHSAHLDNFTALFSVGLGIILGDLDLIHGLVVKQESRWSLFLRGAAFIGVWHILVFDIFLFELSLSC